MANHCVEVKQLRSDTGNSFLNVISYYGGIGVETHAPLRPTYLCNSGNFWNLFQFDDEDCASEWLQNNTTYSRVWKLKSDGCMELLVTAPAAELIPATGSEIEY